MSSCDFKDPLSPRRCSKSIGHEGTHHDDRCAEYGGCPECKRSAIEWRNVEKTNGPGRELHEADVGWAKAWIWRDSAAGWLLTCNAVLLTGAKLDAATLDEAKAAALQRIADFAYQRECSFSELRRL